MKIIKQEYATKYLESLNIEPTAKNIAMILKKYPLENCEITAGWKSTVLDLVSYLSRSKRPRNVCRYHHNHDEAQKAEEEGAYPNQNGVKR